HAVAFDAPGARIATGSEDQTARVWDAKTGKQLLSIKHPDFVHFVAFSPEGKQLVTGFGDGGIQVSNCEAGETVLMMGGEQQLGVPMSNAFAMSPDGIAHRDAE